jgi:hypothetical protein
MLFFKHIQAWFSAHPLSDQALAAQADQSALAHLVPRKFESLEVWLLLFCGVYSMLVTLTVVGGSREIMLISVGMVCMAVWRRFNPARNQTQWALGALCAMLMVTWIYLNPSSGGSTGPYLFLLILFAVAYPLLMEASHLSVFTVALLVLYFASGWHRRANVGTELFFMRGLLLLGITILSGRFGTVLRQTEHSVDKLRRDTASLAYNEHGLARYGSRLLKVCAAEAQPCTLVLLPVPHNWHAPIDVSGKGSEYSAAHSHQIQNRALRDMALHLTLSLPSDAIVSRNTQGDWVVLVPWLETQAVLVKLELAFGRPMQLPFGPRQEEFFVAITPCAVTSRGAGDSVAMMHARAQDIWLRGVRTGAVDSDTMY